MDETGVRTRHSVTARTARVFRRDVIGRYHWLRVKPRLKAILLSCAVGVLGPVAVFAGAAGHFHGSAVTSTQPTIRRAFLRPCETEKFLSRDGWVCTVIPRLPPVIHGENITGPDIAPITVR